MNVRKSILATVSLSLLLGSLMGYGPLYGDEVTTDELPEAVETDELPDEASEVSPALADESEASPIEEQPIENETAVISKNPNLGEKSQSEAASGFELAFENKEAALYYDPSSLQIRFYDKKRRLVSDLKAVDGQKGNRLTQRLQRSNFQITLLKNLRDLGVQSENDYELAIEAGQFEVEPIENGIELRLRLGNEGLSVDDLPVAIPSDKMYEKVLKHLKKKDRKRLKKLYREFQDRYTRRDDSSMSSLQVKLYHDLLFKKGKYTVEDLEEDNARYGVSKSSSQLKIELTIQYLLDGSDLLVRVPLDRLKINPEGLEPYILSLLPYAMSANEAESGYFVLPDGAGSLVRFNNGKTQLSQYLKRIYGRDRLFEEKQMPGDLNIKLPVFGMRREQQGLLAILEDGKDLAQVSCEISGKTDEYNKVYFSYRLLDVDRISTLGSSTVTHNKTAERRYEGALQIRFKQLSDAEANPLEMARIYRDYLKVENLWPTAAEETSKVQIHLNFVGMNPERKFFAGIPYASQRCLSRFADVKQILGELELRMPGSIVDLSYSALDKYGLIPGKLNPLRVDRSLGSEAEEKALRERVEAQGGQFSYRLPVQMVRGSRGFKKHQDFARSLSGDFKRLKFFNKAIQIFELRDESPYLIAPTRIGSYLQEIVSEVRRQASSLIIEDLGQTPVAQYQRRANILRHEAIDYEKKALQGVTGQVRVALCDPADYSLAASSEIIDLASHNSRYKLFDATIPFVSFIYGDDLKTTLEAFDACAEDSLEYYALQVLETGAIPQLRLSIEGGLELENSPFEALLGTEVDKRYEDIERLMAIRRIYLEEFAGAKRIRFMIDEANFDLHRLDFDNGKTLLLNYGKTPCQYLTKSIAAEDYLICESRELDSSQGDEAANADSACPLKLERRA
ncbi:MAG: DUF5696 domain-containing protein [Eubacteriales bacterium]|nr:DUF5696 domain-containing protein [Eubacteriales bacterium]